MSIYLYNEDEIHGFIQILKKIDDKMNESYVKADKINSNIINSSWDGQAKDAMVAFMDLLLQFHGKFQGEKSPINMASKEYDELLFSLDDFYKFQEFINITKI